MDNVNEDDRARYAELRKLAREETPVMVTGLVLQRRDNLVLPDIEGTLVDARWSFGRAEAGIQFSNGHINSTIPQI